MLEKWYIRVLRRFMVVFASGGLLAVVEVLRGLQGDVTDPLQVAYMSAIIATLVAVDKALRDHTSDELIEG